MAIFRYISRSFEISYAFGKDVLQENHPSSGLGKYDRIKLALMSYMEIFIYSASAYLILPTVKEPIDALSLSFNVGSLTNVGFAFGQDADLLSNMVFVQVFCTLSLVVLSLASYLSRTDKILKVNSDSICKCNTIPPAPYPTGRCGRIKIKLRR